MRSCLRNEGDSMANIIDLTEKKFKRLTVIKRVEDYVSPKGQHKPQWLCQCECGSEVVVLGENLRKGLTTSCGCFSKELSSKKGKLSKKYNTYDLSGEYGVGYTLKGEEFYFDLEDYDKIKDYCWYRTAHDYVIAKTLDGSDAHIKFHRLLFPYAQQVDHIKHINYDNRKSQLRPVTVSQNAMNRKNYKNNMSGHKGVYWHKRDNRWIAYITVNKHIYQKKFKNFDDAVKQRKEWEDKYFGEYSYNNSMKGAL